ncbi:ABC transporter permease [Solwaraspora sp. WMMD406]|uniref:ABC transporter permease n=1 Tax=Solwaraspora sp. WMMD406 TaxID=3016095 RepID=UPI002416A7EF|nr:ABC transporter permease [Solwaraspora sp. WMMD406]MDG4768453.1 ABC transporter permease [Solwaraspora sp. WMMD406]
MAYDDSPYRRRTVDGADAARPGPGGDIGYGDPAYHPDSDLRSTAGHQAGSFTTASFTTAEFTPSERTPRRSRRRRPSQGLDDVFDDPRHGERGRDRLTVHLIWELVLLLVVGGVGYLLYRADPAVLDSPSLDTLLAYGAGLGLLVLGAGVTLRTGAPNLALGPVAVAAALHFAENGDNGVIPVLITVGIWAVLLGVLTAVLVTGLQVPGWAGSLVAACVAVVFIQQRSGPVDVQGGYDPTTHAFYLFGGFAVLALLGGAFGTIKTIRRTVGRFRPVADPADRRGALAAVLTSGAIVVSMVFAAFGGVLLAALGSGPVDPSVGLEWSALALGAALLGGTSVFGRRGGIFGILFAVAGLTIFIRYAELRDLDIALYATAAVTVAVGLAVTRLIETYGRPVPARMDEFDDDPADDGQWQGEHGEQDESRSTTTAWNSGRPVQESWSSTLPAQPTDTRDRWDTNDGWGTNGR